MASFLVVDEPIGNYQCVCLLGLQNVPDGDRSYDAAAKLYRQKPTCELLLLQSRPDRLVETGVLPSFEKLSRRELEKRGVPRQSVSTIQSDGCDQWAAARALNDWLIDHPKVHVAILCGRLGSAHLRYVLNTVLDPDQVARVCLQTLPDRRIDETNWWTNRLGIKAVGIEWLRQIQGWCASGDHPPPVLRSANEYQRYARQTLLEAVPYVDGRPEQAEYVMVLNGGENTRPFAAAVLFNEGLARHVLVAGVAPSPLVEEGLLPPYEEINRRVLLSCGVPESDITILPTAVKTTYDEAKALAAFLQDRPKARVFVVTSDYHTRRSRWVFARALADRAGQVSLVPVATDESWQDPTSFLAIVTDYFKLAFYLVCYGHLGPWLAACSGFALVALWVRRREALSR